MFDFLLGFGLVGLIIHSLKCNQLKNEFRDKYFENKHHAFNNTNHKISDSEAEKITKFNF